MTFLKLAVLTLVTAATLFSLPTVASATTVIIAEGDMKTFNDPLYMPQVVLLRYATDCIDVASAGDVPLDPITCCQAMELSHDLLVKELMPLNPNLSEEGLALYDKMLPYLSNDPSSIGVIGYEGCISGEI